MMPVRMVERNIGWSFFVLAWAREHAHRLAASRQRKKGVALEGTTRVWEEHLAREAARKAGIYRSGDQ